MVIFSPLVANVLQIINLPMALVNLPIAANGLPLVPIANDMWETEICHFPGAKTKDFYYYLVPFLKKKQYNIILHLCTMDNRYKNEVEIL